MPIAEHVLDQLRVEPGTRANLAGRDPGWKGGPETEGLGTTRPKAAARRQLGQLVEELAAAQELLWACDRCALLVVFQALDAAGKDGTIKHVMSGVNPQGCQVVTFKAPSAEELDHDFLWRCAKALPERGRIGIFNRSYYEEVLAVRVHPELLEAQKLPPGGRGKRFWKDRFESINAFERHLDRNATKIVKFFLHVSKDEQRRRFLERLDDPAKQWKWSAADLATRARFDDYMEAYEEAVTATSTTSAPWYVIPADHKYVMRTLVAGVLVHTVASLGLSYPEVSAEARQAMEEARRALLSG